MSFLTGLPLLVIFSITLSLLVSVEGDRTIPFNNPAIVYTGRWNVSSQLAVADWPGASMTVSFTNSSTLVVSSLSYSDDYVNVTIVSSNGTTIVNERKTLVGNFVAFLITLVPSQTYTITVTKVTEAFVGQMALWQLMVSNDAIVLGARRRARKIEFIGDDLMTGFGILGNSSQQRCVSFTAATQDITRSYAWLVAESLAAEASIVAYNGKGLNRNWDDYNATTRNAMPSLYPKRLTTDATGTWNFTSWVPDAVVIHLGSNDYFTQPSPTQSAFINNYVDFMKVINSRYAPRLPQIFVACGGYISPPAIPYCSYVQQVAAQVKVPFIDLQNLVVIPGDVGCAGHPNVNAHVKMANVATTLIKKTMGW